MELINRLTFIDWFAGMGGFRLGMEKAGHKCLGYVEIMERPRIAYEGIHDTKGEWTDYDIRTIRIEDMPRADVWCAGCPAKITVKTEKEKDLAEIVQDYFLQSLTISGVSKKKINPDSFSLKTLKILSIFEEDLISSQYSLNWTRSGTMWNGKSSIAGNTKSLKTGLGCTLSDIIEEQPGEEFFLSPKEVDRLTFKGPKMDGK